MEIIHDQFIGIYKNAFPSKWCDTVSDIFEKYFDNTFSRDQFWSKGTLSKGQTFLKAKDRALSFNHLKDEFIKKEDIPLFEKMHLFFNNKFRHIYLNHYSTTYAPHYESFSLTPPQFQRTLPGEGYHQWHFESLSALKKQNSTNSSEFNQLSRFGVYTVYLNDVEEGGETEFLYQHLRVKPEKGTLVIFPAYFTHLHRGNPPLSGKKEILTGWMHIAAIPPSQ